VQTLIKCIFTALRLLACPFHCCQRSPQELVLRPLAAPATTSEILLTLFFSKNEALTDSRMGLVERVDAAEADE
jgi:hypothetical protein